MVEEKVKKVRKKEVKVEEKPTGKFSHLNDPWKTLEYPLLTERSIGMVEKENKLVFIVNVKASKKQIKSSVERALSVKVENVNTMIDVFGKKRAFVKLTKDYKANEIATRFGML